MAVEVTVGHLDRSSVWMGESYL